MQELRCLFALMVGSTRRFVDPSAAVELLRDAFRTSEAQQVQHIFFSFFFTGTHINIHRCNLIVK